MFIRSTSPAITPNRCYRLPFCPSSYFVNCFHWAGVFVVRLLASSFAVFCLAFVRWKTANVLANALAMSSLVLVCSSFYILISFLQKVATVVLVSDMFRYHSICSLSFPLSLLLLLLRPN